MQSLLCAFLKEKANTSTFGKGNNSLQLSFSPPPLIIFVGILRYLYDHMVLVSEAEEEKRRETICRNKIPWTWGNIYWEWEPSFISSADSSVRGRIKPSSEDGTAWLVSAPVPPLPIYSSSESSQAFTSAERPVCLQILTWYYSGTWPQFFCK